VERKKPFRIFITQASQNGRPASNEENYRNWMCCLWLAPNKKRGVDNCKKKHGVQLKTLAGPDK
jgi:hypothetical protein